jgi:hypothetical protein
MNTKFPQNAQNYLLDLILEIQGEDDDLEMIRALKGEYPMIDEDTPISEPVVCRDQFGNALLTSPDMDGESLLIERLEEMDTPPVCFCFQCLDDGKEHICQLITCSQCGNKRCPHAKDHRYQCTQSNEPGQTPILTSPATLTKGDC